MANNNVISFEDKLITKTLKYDKTLRLKSFKSKVKSDEKIPGYLNLYKQTIKDGKVFVEEIRNLSQTLEDVLTEFKILILEFDENKPSATGGIGTSSTATNLGSTEVFIPASVGEGASIDAKGYVKGGDGIAGDIYGSNFVGTAGKGLGGNVTITGIVTSGSNGEGIGGDIVSHTVSEFKEQTPQD
ncbi:hypothetical protein F4859DRAFT_517523 [Xylaria cf. heliscus]|nr:hypothetical protein F4859DRAFT_517523 [Xylaria cf. heliscus]